MKEGAVIESFFGKFHDVITMFGGIVEQMQADVPHTGL